VAEPAEAAIRGSYEALSDGDIDGFLASISPDAELHEIREMPDARVYHGREEIREWAEATFALVEDWEWKAEEIVRETDRVYLIRVRLTLHGRGSGIPITQVLHHVLEFSEGKAAVIRGFLGEQEALEAARRQG
jgi:ketosteroid isomerase-like protein